MKNFVYNIIAGICLVFILSGCLKEKEPTVTLMNGRFMTGNVEISPGGVLMFKWMAEKGQSDLANFTLKENGVDMAGFPKTDIETDIYYDSTFLEGPVTRGDYTYSFIATDVDGKIGDRAIVVTVE